MKLILAKLLSVFILSPIIFLNSPVMAENAKEENPLKNYRPKLGKLIKEYYTVKKDDNLYKISRNLKKDYYFLKKINKLNSPFLYIGNKLTVSLNIIPDVKDSRIIVNIPEKRLYHFSDSKLEKIYKVSVGTPPDWKTPIGSFYIANKIKAPGWHVPKSIQEEMKEKGKEVKTYVPPGPDNPLGNWWMGLNRSGIGIHSTNAPASIGYSVTHGCVRLSPKDAEELFSKAEKKMPVDITYQTFKLAVSDNDIYFQGFRDNYAYKPDLNKEINQLISKNYPDLSIDQKLLSEAIKNKISYPQIISKKSEKKLAEPEKSALPRASETPEPIKSKPAPPVFKESPLPKASPEPLKSPDSKEIKPSPSANPDNKSDGIEIEEITNSSG